MRIVAPLLLLALLAPADAGAAPVARIEPMRFHAGDDPAWAAAELDDGGWRRGPVREAGVWWLRTAITFERPIPAGSDLALRVLLPAAFEVYWDGEPIGRNGVVGTTAGAERPGRFAAWFPLDQAATGAGRHTLAIRASSHHAWRNLGLFRIELLDRGATTRREGRRTALFFACVGLLLFAAAVFALVYRATGRRPATRLLALLCLSVGAMLALEYAKYVHPYTYPWHLWRLLAISALALVAGCLLPAFILRHLELPGRRLILPALAATSIALGLILRDPDYHALWTLRLAAALSFGLAGWGLARRRRHAGWVLAAVTPVLLPTFFTGLRYADHWFFAGFVVTVLMLLVEVGADLAVIHRQREEAVRRAERLRYELLRKTIQPHFLMNTLAAAIGHTEEDPARGIEVLRDLARELEAFLAVGERTLIPLADELELCRRHVATMRHLLDRPLRLEVDGELDGGAVPPGLLLTLVENALTHGDWSGDGALGIHIEPVDGGLHLEVANPAHRDAAAGAERTGLAYVRRQLEHTGGTGSSLSYGLEGDHWVARVRLAADSRRSRSSR